MAGTAGTALLLAGLAAGTILAASQVVHVDDFRFRATDVSDDS